MQNVHFVLLTQQNFSMSLGFGPSSSFLCRLNMVSNCAHRVELPQQIVQLTPSTRGGGDNFKATLAKSPIGAYFVKSRSCAYSKNTTNVLSTLSWHVFTFEPTIDIIMLPSQDPIEKFTLASTRRLEVTHMVEIKNLKDVHVQEMDVLQSQIFRLITDLWALTTPNAWGKRPMATTMNIIKRVGIKVGAMSIMNTNTPNKCIMIYSPYISQSFNS